VTHLGVSPRELARLQGLARDRVGSIMKHSSSSSSREAVVAEELIAEILG
jgi:hypothetical protein